MKELEYPWNYIISRNDRHVNSMNFIALQACKVRREIEALENGNSSYSLEELRVETNELALELYKRVSSYLMTTTSTLYFLTQRKDIDIYSLEMIAETMKEQAQREARITNQTRREKLGY